MSVYGVLDATLSLGSCTTLGFKMSCYKQLYNPYDLDNQLYTEQTTVFKICQYNTAVLKAMWLLKPLGQGYLSFRFGNYWELHVSTP